MQLPGLARALVVSAAASVGLACQIEVPIDLALTGEDNTITITVPNLPPELGVSQTTLSGYVQTTMTIDAFNLFQFGGIPASISVDDLLIAGDELLAAGGLINAGNVCIYQDPDLVGGGLALVRPFKGEVDFMLELATLVEITNTLLAQQLGLEPLPFGSVIDDTFPLALADLLGIFLGGGAAGGLEVTQTISDVIDPSIPLFGGATIDAQLTLASTDALPTSDALDACIAFLAGP